MKGAPRLFLAAAAMASMLALGACEEAVRGVDRDHKILDIANGAEPASLDPHKANGTWEANIIGDMFVGLTTEDPWGRVTPGMATNWETSDDGLTWTFFLRDALWSDGEPVTAYDFEYAFRHIMDPKNLAEYASLLYVIHNGEAVNDGKLPPEALGVRAIDEKTLEIKLEYPAPYLPQLLMHQTTFPIPKHVVEKWGDEWIKPAHIEVNGPYKLVKWWSNYIIELKKNPLFYDARNVCLNQLYFYPTTDSDAVVRAFKNREYGWATRFPGSKYDILKKEMPKEVRAAPTLLTQYLSFNMTKKPFDDPRVRLALSEAIDREFIVRNINKSGYQPGYQFVPPGMPHYDNSAHLKFRGEPLAERRADAKRLLEEAGFGPNRHLSFEYSFRSGGDGPKIAVALQGDWREIAPWVDVQLVPTETQIHYANLRVKKFDIGDGGWQGDYADPQNFLYLLQSNAGAQNYPGYSNPQYDALMEQANHELDPDARGLLMSRAEQIMLDDNPIVPLSIGASQNLVDSRITGYEDNISDVHRARWMCFAG
ncbi:MAG TPA: peptide ABC transporter substrate-binding protein [Caulobacterales bacterium]|nr:peptide ABC transporter substrate-binding protein [Caulobacterales bacterium]